MNYGKILNYLGLILLLITSFSIQANAPAPEAAGKNTPQAPVQQNANSPRLSKEVIPTRYTLSFEPDFKQFTFLGTEQINLTVYTETRSITLNGLEITINKASIRSNASTPPATIPVQQATIEYNAKNEQITFNFKSPLAPGHYILDVNFAGILNNQLRGFYRSFYIDKSNKKHWLAATQMESTDARRMFPCFDEPDFKARYQISAIIDPRLVAISNAPILREESENEKKRVIFEATPKISTYLVALIVGELKRTGTKMDANGVPISVWTTPNKQHLGKFALDMACEILAEEARYFGIPYYGKKLDLIALPDLTPGAMENLGAITFQEEYLLVDEKTGTTFTKRDIASIEAHEIAHQWFGDLVTMRWWEDLWLNESFATWMSIKTIEALRPEWRFLALALEDYNDAKTKDQLQTTRAIHATVLNPAQAAEMFDTITYDKGSAILRMLEFFVGEKIFQQGIHNYLTAHSYGNATTQDLWEAIASVPNTTLPIASIMQSWIYQAGLPLLTASLEKKGHAITLKQTRFFEAADAKPTQQQWQIPIVLDTFEQNTLSPLLTTKQQVYSFKKPHSTVFANKDGAGFYRVQYSQTDFDLLAQKFAQLSSEEKIVLLSDTTALATANKIPVENALNLMFNIKKETDPLVQTALVQGFYLPLFSVNASTKLAYQTLIQTYLRPLKQELGWQAKKGEQELSNDLRNNVLELLGTYGQDKATIREALALFHLYLQDAQIINRNVLPSIARIVAFNGGETEYQEIKQAWKSAKSPEDEKRFLLTLAYFNQPQLIAETLNLSLSSKVRGQDAPGVLNALLKRKESQEQAWTFVSTHWPQILQRLPEVQLHYIPTACSNFYTPSAEKSLRAFYTKHEVPYARSGIARTLEEVHINVLFQKKNAKRIRAWILNNVREHLNTV